jgi:hypothetical protein
MFVVRKTAGRSHFYVDLDVAPRHRVPGVTTIIKAMANAKLENYASTATADYAVNNWAELDEMPPADRLRAIMGGRWNKRNEGAANGTDVHRFGEKLLAGEGVDIPPHLRGYVDSYVGFMDLSDIHAEHIEVPCYSEAHQYAGTIDIIGDLILPDTEEWEDVVRDESGRSKGLLDPKTGKGVYESAALQLTAYVHSDALILAGATSADRDKRVEIETPPVDFAAAVHVHPDGRPATLIRVDATDESFRKFCYIRQVYEIQQTADELLYPPTPYPYRAPEAAQAADPLAEIFEV